MKAGGGEDILYKLNCRRRLSQYDNKLCTVYSYHLVHLLLVQEI